MFKLIKEKFGGFFKGKGGSSSKVINPERDWKIILVFFLIVFLLIAVFNYLLFLQIRSGEIFKAEENGYVYFQSFDQQSLDEISEFFDEKERRRREELGSEDFELLTEDLDENIEEEFLFEVEEDEEVEEMVEEIDTEEGS